MTLRYLCVLTGCEHDVQEGSYAHKYILDNSKNYRAVETEAAPALTELTAEVTPEDDEAPEPEPKPAKGKARK